MIVSETHLFQPWLAAFVRIVGPSSLWLVPGRVISRIVTGALIVISVSTYRAGLAPLPLMSEETVTTEQDKRDLADGDWWREICTALGARLVGWTFRSEATILYPDTLNVVELDGRIAATIHHLTERQGP